MDVFCHPPSNIFLKQIMSDALEEHDRRVSIGGIYITNLEIADALAEEEQKLEALVESLDKTSQVIRWRSLLRRPD